MSPLHFLVKLNRQSYPDLAWRDSLLYYLESATIDDFGEKMSLHRTDVEHLRSVFMAVENGDIGMLKSLGIRVSMHGVIFSS